MKVTVKVQNDHLERLSKVQKPIVAVEELIWNALDADATNVRIRFDYGARGALDRITVTDNGHGLAYEKALPAFENLGGSWKRGLARTPRNRVLHGKAGKGRFRAFALGGTVRLANAIPKRQPDSSIQDRWRQTRSGHVRDR